MSQRACRCRVHPNQLARPLTCGPCDRAYLHECSVACPAPVIVCGGRAPLQRQLPHVLYAGRTACMGTLQLTSELADAPLC